MDQLMGSMIQMEYIREAGFRAAAADGTFLEKNPCTVDRGVKNTL